jgi:hypothetical protein
LERAAHALAFPSAQLCPERASKRAIKPSARSSVARGNLPIGICRHPGLARCRQCRHLARCRHPRCGRHRARGAPSKPCIYLGSRTRAHVGVGLLRRISDRETTRPTRRGAHVARACRVSTRPGPPYPRPSFSFSSSALECFPDSPPPPSCHPRLHRPWAPCSLPGSRAPHVFWLWWVRESSRRHRGAEMNERAADRDAVSPPTIRPLSARLRQRSSEIRAPTPRSLC